MTLKDQPLRALSSRRVINALAQIRSARRTSRATRAERVLLSAIEKEQRKKAAEQAQRERDREIRRLEPVLGPRDFRGDVVDAERHASVGVSVQPWEINAAIRRERCPVDPDAWYERCGFDEPDFGEIEATIERNLTRSRFMEILQQIRSDRTWSRVLSERHRAQFRP